MNTILPQEDNAKRIDVSNIKNSRQAHSKSISPAGKISKSKMLARNALYKKLKVNIEKLFLFPSYIY